MTNILSVQKILLALGIIVFVGAAAAGATGAFFSDTETSTGNTFAAGEIDLLIDNTSYGFDWNRPGEEDPQGDWGPNEANSWAAGNLNNCGPNNDQPCLFFNFIDLKPGDYGEDTISIRVNNNDSYACMALDLTATPENGQNEPELDVPDTTLELDEGELQNYLSFIFWHDDGDNVLEVGEDVIEELSGLPGTIFTGNWLPIAESGDEPLIGESVNYIGKGWCFGTMAAAPVAQAPNPNGPTPGNTGFTCSGAGEHNIAQTDGITVDVEFYAVQSRNNDDFLCSSLNEQDPVVTTLTLAKTVIPAEFVADSAFTLTADGPSDISGIEGAGAVTSAPITPGTYNLSETGGPGGATVDWECSVAMDDEDTVTIAPGASVVCTVTNTFLI